jgi:GTP-binding protein
MGEWQVPFGIVFTKADKETQKTVAQNVRLFSEALLKQWEELPPMWVTSAEKRLGRDSLLDFITEMNAAYSERQKNS